MAINQLVSRLLASVWLTLLAANLYAHEPGLSLLEVKIDEQQTVAKLVLADQDFSTLFPVDVNRDGKITALELSAINAETFSLLSASVELWSDGIRLRPREVKVQPTEPDVLTVTLKFVSIDGVRLTVKSPDLLKLSRGHRQYLSVTNAVDETIAEQIFSRAVYEQKIDAHKQPGGWNVFINFLREGVHHIWIGLDHILFLVTLLLPAAFFYHSGQWRPVQNLRSPLFSTLKIVTAFTAAHSITLSLAALQILTLPSKWVESAIALTVVLAAVNNLRPIFPNSQWLIAFVFGLIHGFGFASVLSDITVQEGFLTTSLLAFNLGVEIGQVAIVGVLFPIIYFARNNRFFPSFVLKGGSFAAIIVAAGWLGERVLDIQFMVI